MCCAHGDFGPDQVILSGGRTVTVDWDNCRIADPTSDVATFIVRLERLALKRLGSIRALDVPAAVFLRTYLASGGHPQVAARLAFYKAGRWFAEAQHQVKAKAKEPRWGEWTEAMLDEGLQTLESYRYQLPPDYSELGRESVAKEHV